MMRESGSYIAGTFLSVDNPDGEIARFNPTHPDDCIGHFPFSIKHAESAVSAARQSFPAWSKLSDDTRWSYLQSFADLIKKNESHLAKEITREIGKPYWEALLELASVHQKFLLTQESMRKLVSSFQVPSKDPAIIAQCRFKPHGPLAVLSPFNFPLHLALGHVIPALAAGNTVVLKPSELAPSVSQMLAQLAHEAKFPAGVFNLVQGDARIGKSICYHPDIRGVLFTGSYAVGKSIQQNLLDDPRKIVVLEMGGKNSSIIWEDAKLDRSLNLALQSAMITTGQRCTCTSRLFIHEKVWQQALAKLKTLAGEIVLGDPTNERTFMGPLVSQSAKERVLRASDLAKKQGFTSLLSERTLPSKGHFVSPQIHFTESKKQAPYYSDDEIFGPDLMLYPIADLQDATQVMEQSRYGLACAIYCQDERVYQDFFHSVTAGVINWNRPTTGPSSALPFGGQKASGNHFPTAHFAPYYCTYPVANMMDSSHSSLLDPYPGFCR